MNINLLGASFYYVNRQFGCTGAIACHNSGDTEEVIILKVKITIHAKIAKIVGPKFDI